MLRGTSSTDRLQWAGLSDGRELCTYLTGYTTLQLLCTAMAEHRQYYKGTAPPVLVRGAYSIVHAISFQA